jgi:GH35 family endo-1,4-beta-xylanase
MLPWYLDTIGKNFWSITPENIFKWGYYEFRKGQYQRAMKLLKEQYMPFAKKYNMELVRGHAVEWGIDYRDCLAAKGKKCSWPVQGFDCAKYTTVSIGL